MGVTDLWSVLEPIKSKCSLKSLANKTLAVDLSIWVVENENVTAMQGIVEKAYLRNIFYRVINLRRLGIKLVFVIEGKAPRLKIDEMNRRLQARGGAGNGGRGGRGNFDAKLRECQEMLHHMGMPCIQSNGEAEAMCAAMNNQGIVDGVITNDGDAFLYGATTVYRNLTLEKKDPHMICYHMEDMKQRFGLDRNKLVILGLLLGCDYLPKGVPGVGKEKAYELMRQWGDVDAIEQFESWTDKSLDEDSPRKETKPRHCKLCRHVGTDKKHTERGCEQCYTEIACKKQDRGARCSCQFCIEQSNLEVSKIERDVMGKAKNTQGFPFKEVSNEFLVNNETPPSLSSLRWTHPELKSLQRFNYTHMKWNEQTTTEKILALLTYCEISKRCHTSSEDASEGTSTATTDQVQLESLLRLTKKDKIPSFEVQWIILGQKGENGDNPLKLKTFETEADIAKAYPKEYDEFQKMQEQKSKAKKTPTKGKGLKTKTNHSAKSGTSGKTSTQSTLTNYFKTTKKNVASTTTTLEDKKAESTDEPPEKKAKTVILIS